MSFRSDADALLHRVNMLERENERLHDENRMLAPKTPNDLISDPRFPGALVELRALFHALRRELGERGERISGEETHRFPTIAYDGFYAKHEDVTLFVALHMRACLLHGLSPLIAQLCHRDARLVGTQLADTWEIHDQSLVSWNEGPFVSLQPAPGLDRHGQIDQLVTDLGAIRGALRVLDAG